MEISCAASKYVYLSNVTWYKNTAKDLPAKHLPGKWNFPTDMLVGRRVEIRLKIIDARILLVYTRYFHVRWILKIYFQDFLSVFDNLEQK